MSIVKKLITSYKSQTQKTKASPYLLIPLVLIFCFSAIAGIAAYAAPLKEITVVSDDNYPPYIFRDEKGHLQGILVDEWRLWEQKTGIKVDLRGMDWDKAIKMMAEGNAQVIDTIFFTEERAKTLAFSAPYASIDVPIFFHKDISGINDVESLHGFTIGVKAGDACIDFLKRHGILTLREYPSYESIVRDAAEQKIKVFCIDSPPAHYYLSKMNLEQQYRYTAPLYTGQFHRAVRKERKDLLTVVEKGFAKISRKEHKEIEKRWRGSPIAGSYLTYLFYLIGVFVILGAILLLWNHTLRRKVTQKTVQLQKAFKDLEKSEELFRSYLEYAPDGVYMSDVKGTFIYGNRKYEEIIGYRCEELIGKNFLELNILPEKSLNKADQFLQANMEGKPTGPDEIELISKEGRIIPVEISTSVVQRMGQRIVLAFVRDITDRKQVEGTLRQNEEKYRTILENIEEGYFEVDLAGSFTFVNDSTCSFLGYSKEEIIGINSRQYTDKEYSKKLFQAFNKVYNTGETAKEFDWQIIRKDGIKRYVEASISLQKDLSGKPTGFRGIARDITERKMAEEELSRVNRALRMLSATNEALIHIMDEATLLNEVCRITVEIGGYRMAWIGFAEQDEAKTVRPVAHAGFESGYIESAKVTWADNERGRGPGGTAIRTGQPCIARNIPLDSAFAPWREAVIQHGYKSNLALPLISEGQTLGEMAIYSIDTDAFDAKEVEILKELADDLAFGITALRTRVKRDETEVALRESEERYRLIAENTADTIAVFDLNLNPTYISPSIIKLRGYTVQEAMTQTLNQMLPPDSLKQAIKTFSDQMALESSGTADPTRTALMELEEYCKDGSTIWVELAASFLRDNNFKPTGILTVTRAITERKLAEAELQQTLESLRKAFGATIQAMVSAVEMRDPYTAGHQKRVADLARVIATEMGLPQEKIDGIRLAGSIHDIGKLSIPAEILSKPTKLTDLEFSLIKEHSRIGYEMLKDVESPWPLAQIVYQHHERMNGSGYPRNLKGDDILIDARIMAVADVVEAMASHRPYRPGLGIEVALEEIEKNKGILYDDVVADACLKLFREKGYQIT